MHPSIHLIGTLDTKGAEIAYLRDRLQALRLATTVVDSGILSEPLGIELSSVHDISRAQAAAYGGYTIDQLIDGETVAEVLDYVQYNPKKLVRTLETWVTQSVKEGRISVEEGKEFLSNYRSGLYGYTYLE